MLKIFDKELLFNILLNKIFKERVNIRGRNRCMISSYCISPMIAPISYQPNMFPRPSRITAKEINIKIVKIFFSSNFLFSNIILKRYCKRRKSNILNIKELLFEFLMNISVLKRFKRSRMEMQMIIN